MPPPSPGAGGRRRALPGKLRRAVLPAAAATRWRRRLRNGLRLRNRLRLGNRLRSGNRLRLGNRFRRRAPHLRLGARGERIAARALRRAGYRVVARNYRPGGPSAPELDLVAWEGRTLAVVEVKTRRGGLGRPLERVDEEKRRRLRRAAARMWAVESRRRRIPPGSSLRLDVVEVWFPTPAPSSGRGSARGGRRGGAAGGAASAPTVPRGARGLLSRRFPGPAGRRWRRRLRAAFERPVVRIRRGAV